MNEPSALREWLFRGLAVEDLLDDLENDGLAVRPASHPDAIQRDVPLYEFSASIRQAAVRALPAYLAFFCLENAVRELVIERMTDSKGSEWWTSVSDKLQTKVRERQDKEGVNRWHIRRGAEEIYYTDFGDLTTIIRNNWPAFQDLFPDQNWVINRLAELEASRNIIAHSNVLDEREIGRVRMYVQDWTRQVG